MRDRATQGKQLNCLLLQPSKKAAKPKRELGEDGDDDDAMEKDVGAPKPPGLRITISSSALGSPGGSKRRLVRRLCKLALTPKCLVRNAA